MKETAIIVPARLESTRFPRKLLYEIAGKPLLLHVADRIAGQVPRLPLYFAVDHPELASVLREAGYSFVMTSPDHPSGSDRIAEANARLRARYVINVQADEPLVTGAQIRSMAAAVRGKAPMATLAIRFERKEDFLDPNQVKVVIDQHLRALYFSRAPIPYPRDEAETIDSEWFRRHASYRHLGLYAYQGDFLKILTHLPPGKLERIERLEQLRVLENGHPIAVVVTDQATIGIDTPEDARRFEEYLATVKE